MTVETDVLIVGAGPAGLALAADLATRGVRCLVVEKRTDVTKHPRATLLGARSMEYYRRLGLAEPILQAGLPTDFRYDVIFATRLSGKVLYHYSSPSPAEYMEMAEGKRPASNDSRWTPYFKVQIGQHALEPIVRDYVATLDAADLRYGNELLDFTDHGDHVEAEIRDTKSGETTKVRALYLAACDGGRSAVRNKLAIPYTGRGAMRRNVSFLFRSAEFLSHAEVGRGNLYFIFTPGNFGVFTMIDGKEIWNYQHYVLDENEDVSTVNPEAKIRAAMGKDFKFEVLRTMHWQHHQSVANSFRLNRVFLVGDSAHLFCPTGGVGMNTAIGDAFDLGWKISATLAGWGGPHLLESYEAERRPIAFRNTIAAASNADRVDSMMRMTPAEIEEDSPAGEEARAHQLPRFRWMSKQFSTMGLHVGYRYADSPIVVPDGTPEPPDDPRVAVQSTWPGCRAPHAWVSPGQTTLDAYDGRSFTLVTLGESADVTAAEQAAADRGIPLKTARFDKPDIVSLYERRFVLVRPDGHVAWRGDALPKEFSDILKTATGH